MSKFILLHYSRGKTRLLVNPITGVCIVEDVYPLQVKIFNLSTCLCTSEETGIIVDESFVEVVESIKKAGIEVIE